jgi:hypothetical protein
MPTAQVIEVIDKVFIQQALLTKTNIKLMWTKR